MKTFRTTCYVAFTTICMVTNFADATTLERFFAMSTSDRVQLIQTCSARIAQDIAPQDAALSQRIVQFFNDRSDTTSEVDGIKAVRDNIVSIMTADNEQLEKGNTARLMQDHPKALETLVVMAVGDNLHVSLREVKGKFVLIRVEPTTNATPSTTHPTSAIPTSDLAHNSAFPRKEKISPEEFQKALQKMLREDKIVLGDIYAREACAEADKEALKTKSLRVHHAGKEIFLCKDADGYVEFETGKRLADVTQQEIQISEAEFNAAHQLRSIVANWHDVKAVLDYAEGLEVAEKNFRDEKDKIVTELSKL